jgi:hypothetical protein
MSYSYISPNFTEYCKKTQILCTRCSQVFKTDNPFSMTCQTCHQRDVDYTVRLGNQTRMFQIDVALMNIEIELRLFENSDYQKVVLGRRVAQLEEEKKKLSQNI